MGPRGGVRLVDVAECAGVTVSTASRALSRPELVRASTRARVETAARELGYVPNRIARAVVTGRTQVVLFVVPDLTNNLFARIARAAQQAARERGYDLLVADSRMSIEREAQIIRRGDRFAEGIILCMPQGSYRTEPDRTPLVAVNRRMPGAHAVLVDQADIVEKQLAHLTDLGHTRMAYLDGPEQYWVSHERRRHIDRFARDHDIEILTEVAYDFHGGRDVADRLSSDRTAVLTFSDAQAAGVIAGATDLGRRVPEDLSVIGVNDMPIARMYSPPITTLHTPVDALGRAALGLLLDAEHAGDGTAIIETLTSELVVRRSTAAAPDRTRRPEPVR